MVYYVYTSAVDEATASPVVVITGQAGTGRTTAARELVRRRGFEAHEFGAMNYGNTKALWEKTHALGVRGGIATQLGLIRGVGAIFDDLDTVSVTTKGRRIIRRVLKLAKMAGRHLLVIYVANRANAVPGLQRLVSQLGTTHHVKLGPPTLHQLEAIAARIATSEGITINTTSAANSIPRPARLDFRAATAHLKKVLCSKNRADDVARVVVGEGDRDSTLGALGLGDTGAEEMARRVLLTTNAKDRLLIASRAPQKTTVIHAANIARVLPSPADRIRFARSIVFAGLCWSRCDIQDPVLYDCTILAGPLAAPTLKSRSSMGSRPLVGTRLHKFQYQYNKKRMGRAMGC